MLKTLKNAWTLVVNLGWLVAIGSIAVPHFQTATPPPIPIVATAEPQSVKEVAVQKSKELPQPIKEVAVEKIREIPQPVKEVAVEKPDPVQNFNRLLVVDRPELKPKPDPEGPVDEQGVPTVWPQNGRIPEDYLPLKGGTPAYLCEGGMCQIDPRYKYDVSEPRVGPEPQIYFPQPPFPNGIPPGETSFSAKARYANAEMRFTLNQFKGRLKWTHKVFQYLDLSKIGGVPWDVEKVFDQNWELKWRIRQIGLLTQGFDTEGFEVPKRPRGKAGLIGVYPSTLGQLQ
jgi:hypothetical protein